MNKRIIPQHLFFPVYPLSFLTPALEEETNVQRNTLRRVFQNNISIWKHQSHMNTSDLGEPHGSSTVSRQPATPLLGGWLFTPLSNGQTANQTHRLLFTLIAFCPLTSAAGDEDEQPEAHGDFG